VQAVARTRSCFHAGSMHDRPRQLFGLRTTSDRGTALADTRCVTPSGLRAGARGQLAPNFARTADTSGLSGHSLHSREPSSNEASSCASSCALNRNYSHYTRRMIRAKPLRPSPSEGPREAKGGRLPDRHRWNLWRRAALLGGVRRGSTKGTVRLRCQPTKISSASYATA
jgi:hypothetical protein